MEIVEKTIIQLSGKKLNLLVKLQYKNSKFKKKKNILFFRFGCVLKETTKF